jgi:hypothetical protein
MSRPIPDRHFEPVTNTSLVLSGAITLSELSSRHMALAIRMAVPTAQAAFVLNQQEGERK